MSTAVVAKSILIVEPNPHLDRPYSLLDSRAFQVARISNPLTAGFELQKQAFDLVLLSCSFSHKKLLHFLDSLKEADKTKIIPLILVVDFSKPYSLIPGLTWDGKLGLLSSLSGAKELNLQLAKLLHL